ncbi:hypothetical protein F3Y22_tig00013915pilonHSYRG00008 [Hibiscus syriacus]|uniref:Reverse transcriptase Ty1/copia-type domain-containing protein n=1 Tax=Hibiscus syriacus TaxID=106335 RepID=A0A6A3C0X0_HIBSY|nr:hypothetical protein F3Y22_tig00013915pilonHSYRG00008 [Hibiscus syriacus]
MTHMEAYFNSLDQSFKTSVKLGNGATVQVQGKGSICVNTPQGDRVFNLESKKVVVTRDVTFDEGSYWNCEKNDVQKHDPPMFEEVFTTDDIENDENSDSFDTANTTNAEVVKTKSLANMDERCNFIFAEPTSFIEASKVPEWIDAMKAKTSAIEKNGTWFLIDRPNDNNVIGGVDYGDTFAPFARLDTIRLLIAIPRAIGLECFIVAGKEHQVYKLKKTFYSLKQAPRVWYYRIDSYLQKLGFQRSINKATLYLKKDENVDFLVISLYVDDLLVMGSNDKVVSEFKLSMQEEFEMSNLVDSPFPLNFKLSKNDGEKLDDPFIFKSIVGSLLYLTATRPDLMFLTMLLSRFLSSPTDVHLGVAKRVLKYVKSTMCEGMNYLKTGSVLLNEYSDTD